MSALHCREEQNSVAERINDILCEKEAQKALRGGGNRLRNFLVTICTSFYQCPLFSFVLKPLELSRVCNQINCLTKECLRETSVVESSVSSLFYRLYSFSVCKISSSGKRSHLAGTMSAMSALFSTTEHTSIYILFFQVHSSWSWCCSSKLEGERSWTCLHILLNRSLRDLREGVHGRGRSFGNICSGWKLKKRSITRWRFGYLL